MAELALTAASMNMAMVAPLTDNVMKITTQTKTSQQKHVEATKAIEGVRKTYDQQQTAAQLKQAKAYATVVSNRKTDMNVTSVAAPAMEQITPTSVEHIPEFGADEQAMMELYESERFMEYEREIEKAELTEMYQQLQNGDLSAEDEELLKERLVADAESFEDSDYEVIYGLSGEPVAVVQKPKKELDYWKASGALAMDAMSHGTDMVMGVFGKALKDKGSALAEAGEQLEGSFGEAGSKWADIFNAEGPVDFGKKLITAASATISVGMNAIDTMATLLDPSHLTDALKEIGLELPIDTGILGADIEGILMRAIEDPSSLKNAGDILKNSGLNMLTNMTGGLMGQATEMLGKTTGALTSMIGNTISKSFGNLAMSKMNSALSAKIMSKVGGMGKRLLHKATNKVTNRFVNTIYSKCLSLPMCGKGANPFMTTIANQVTLCAMNTTRTATDQVRRNSLNSMINAASYKVNYDDVAARQAEVQVKYNRAVQSREQMFARIAASSL